jgi:hypothetical protein
MAKKSSGQKQKGASPSYRLNRNGKLIGPNGKGVAVDVGDTPIVISGGSLKIISTGDLDDDDNQGQTTHELHAKDNTKHVTLVQLIGLVPEAGHPNHFVPSNPANHSCAIIIHYG